MANHKTTLIKNILVSMASILIGILIFEAMASYIIKANLVDENANERSRRYMLFATKDGEPAFRNQENIFTYNPNSTIRAVTFYENGPALHKEYDYILTTNNFGLVQKLDINKNRPSTLVLGDSFTEGQGAIPWFYTLEESNSTNQVQLINGGLLGTGFAQWKILHDMLEASDIQIDKVVVPFISDDYQRVVWNFPNQVLDCLGDIKNCKGNEGYFPLPKIDEVETFVNQLRGFRDKEYEVKQTIKEQRFFRKYFPSLRFIWKFLKNDYKLRFANSNSEAIDFLIKKYGKRIVFLHLPTNEEIEVGNIPNYVGMLAREKIKNAGGELIDGFKACGLESSDYFIYDPHPNPKGYKKISSCVKKAIDDLN
jgi:hypothetical protein